jgi:hypothetical protein
LEEVSMVLVEPRQRHSFGKQSFFRRHSYSIFSGALGRVVESSEESEPAVDFPVQLNFGSPYSSSLTIFFDFDSDESPLSVECRETARKMKDRRLLSTKSFNQKKLA